ncbi:MAG: response regulator [Candidatus Heimdallarchaeota archaeon]
MDLSILIVLLAAILGVIVVVIASYKTFKNIRKEKGKNAQKLFSQCLDALYLDYLMVTDKKSGLNLYTQNYSENFEDRFSQEFRDSIIVMSEFVNLRLILMMRESPSKFFQVSAEELVYDIYKNYGDMIDDFNGDIKPFSTIHKFVKPHLSFIPSLNQAKIKKLCKIRLTPEEVDYVNKAVEIMKNYLDGVILNEEEKNWLIALFKMLRDGDDNYFPYPYIFKPSTFSENVEDRFSQESRGIRNTILIVDYEPDIVNFTEKFLKSEDFDTIKSNNGEEAMRMVEENSDKIALILLDIKLPGRGGYSILEEIKNNEKLKDILVVFYTIKSFSEDIRKGKILGADAYITKTVSGKELLNVVKRILKDQDQNLKISEERWEQWSRFVDSPYERCENCNDFLGAVKFIKLDNRYFTLCPKCLNSLFQVIIEIDDIFDH